MTDTCYYRIKLDIADTELFLTVENQGTIKKLGCFVKDSAPVSDLNPCSPLIKDFQRTHGLSFPDAEFYTCISTVSDMLLPDACIFHGAAFIWKGLSYILTAPSGTGKTTQYLNWAKLYGNDVSIINGDKPALRIRLDHSVMVYPSPWNGKENLHGNKCAELGGIIYLKQDRHNSIHRCTVKEAAPLLFKQVFSLVNDEACVHRMAAFTEKLFRSVPVWVLSNTGDLGSTILTRDTIMAYIEREKDE